MTSSSTPVPPIVRSQADLEALWRDLMGPFGFGGHSVWMLVIEDDDRPLPQITEITEATRPPEDAHIDALASVLTKLNTGRERFAFLRSRPGRSGLTADDLVWARSLYEAARRAGVPCEVVHRACDDDVVPVPLDALAGGDAA